MVHPKKIDKDNQYKIALGALILSASYLEMIVLDLISISLRTDIISAIVIAGHQQARSKIDSLVTLLRLSFGEDNAQSESGPIAILNRARELLDFRNTVVHGFWVPDGENLKATRFSARQRFKRSQTAVKPSMLQEHADEMTAIAEKLESWRDEWWKSEAFHHSEAQ